jgi:hypothetical protein
MAEMLTILLPIPDDADGADSAAVFWDDYDGTVDYSAAPLNRDPVMLFRDKSKARGYGVQPYGQGTVDTRAGRVGTLGAHRYGVDAYGNPPPMLALTFPAPRGYGAAVIGVRIYGPTGDVVGSDLEVPLFVSSENPAPVKTLELESYAAGIATFDFVLVEL